MAIRASVSFKSIVASASHRKLDLNASLLPSLGNQVYFTKLVGVANWQRLFLDDIHVNATRTVYFFNNSFNFLESQELSVGKGVTDSLTIGSLDPIFDVISSKTDTLNTIDYTIIGAGKVAVDLVSFNEAQTFNTIKSTSDSIAFNESVVTLLTFIRSFSDTSLLTDNLSLASTKNSLDSFSFSDELSTNFGKSSGDSFALSEQLLAETGKFLPDPVVMVDTFNITRQPYSFIFNDVGGVVSVTGAPNHNFTLSDTTPVFNIETALQDYFALDDFAQVNKDSLGVKVNVVGFSDQIDFDHVVTSSLLNKAFLGNMVLNA